MNEHRFHISPTEASKLLENENARFVEVMKSGTMKVEYFAPQHLDRQMPHNQDEIYVIISGTSGFVRNGETVQCKQGDVIFVPAKMSHRFINFSPDFATWVIFYGNEIL